MTLNEIVGRINAGGKHHRPILIAIEGYGGSGKTTLANQLLGALGDAWIVNMDDFIVKEKINELS